MEALGMIELNSISQGILAADAVLKAANVEIMRAQPVCPGKYVVIVSGGVADVTGMSTPVHCSLRITRAICSPRTGTGVRPECAVASAGGPARSLHPQYTTTARRRL